jgi:uncharacterized protein
MTVGIDPSAFPLPRLVAAILTLAVFLAILLVLPERDPLGRSLPVSMLFGGAFGLVLQRSRFCFYCMARDFFEHGDPRGLVGILVALAIGLAGYTAVFGAWLPNPGVGRLPPDAHIGPVSLTLAAGAFAFGVGMAVSGSCISAHLYRLGEGSGGSIVALFGALGGFVLGFMSWNALYLGDIRTAPLIWLPASLGYGGALALQLAALAALAAWLMRRGWPQAPAAGPFEGLLRMRWPAHVGGLLIGWIAVLAYLRVGPLGVTAEFGSIARTMADAAGALPATLHGLDGLAGCATVVKETVVSRNGVFVLGLVLAALAAALVAGDWRPSRPAAADLPRLFLGGLLLGWGAMVALGCTVGVLLSGIMAGSLSGWVFAVFCFGGTWIGWVCRHKLGRRPAYLRP